MGKLLMIQEDDDRSIEMLKKKMGARTKIDVVRAGLELLEKEVERAERIKNWQRVVAIVTKSSRQVNQEFQKHSRLKRT